MCICNYRLSSFDERTIFLGLKEKEREREREKNRVYERERKKVRENVEWCINKIISIINSFVLSRYTTIITIIIYHNIISKGYCNCIINWVIDNPCCPDIF